MDAHQDFDQELKNIEGKIAELTRLSADDSVQFGTEIAQLEKKKADLEKTLYASLSAWQTVQIARHPQRPLLRDYIENIFSEFIELHGDRRFGDDHGLIGGFATIGDRRAVLIGHQKGRTVEDNVKMNFGMASPDGYRKALRIMKLAEKYRLPVISFIDTPGAYPGLDAEARGQAEAIATNLAAMALLEVPMLVIVSGEGGSGGALGIGMGDTVMMLSYAVYSVISPEGCASILWRDGAKAPEAADALKITAESLKKLGVVDEIIPEPLGGAHRDPRQTMENVKTALLKGLKKHARFSPKKLVETRYEKYADIGRWKNWW